MMTESVHPVLIAIAEVVDLVGIAIVLLGAIKFLVLYVGVEAHRLGRHDCVVELQRARRVLGGYILVALELMIVNDVISSVLNRTLESLAGLAVIVALRTAIGYFLERELRDEPPGPTSD